MVQHPLRDSNLAPWNGPVFFAVLVLTALVMLLANFWFIPRRIWRPAHELTHGVFFVTLQVGLPSFLAVVAIVSLLGGFKLKAIGLDRKQIFPAAAVIASIWGMLHLIAAVKSFDADGSIQFASIWIDTPGEAIGTLLGQFFGNALFEETVFRGFILAQVYVRFRDRDGGNQSQPVGKAIIIAAILFALEHIPNRMMKGYSNADLIGDQVGVFLIGLLWTWMYLWTGNLFFVIGAHSLHNYPTLLLEMPGGNKSAKVTATFLAIIVTFFWPVISSKMGARDRSHTA